MAAQKKRCGAIHLAEQQSTKGKLDQPLKIRQAVRQSRLRLKNSRFEPVFLSILGFLARFPELWTHYAPKKAKRRMLWTTTIMPMAK